MPVFFKLYRADATLRGVKPPMVVERQPVDDFVHRLSLCGESFAVQPSNFQACPQTFRRRIVTGSRPRPFGARNVASLVSPAVAFETHRQAHQCD